MATPPQKPGLKPAILCFGVFQIDLAVGELRKRGVRVSLQQKPFQVLVALLERPGQVVTREEIRLRLWPSDEYGEFDLGINTAVRKIRQALGDSAEAPRFVETLPKVGYRFLAPVEHRAKEMDSPAAHPPGPVRSRRRQLALLALGVAGLGALAALVLPKLTTPESLLLEVRPLTTYPGSEGEPSLSPDGSQVAFIWNAAAGNIDIYVKVIGEEKVTRLTSDPARDIRPTWSPDGRWIAFVRYDPRLRNGTVFLISPFGGPEQEVTDGVIKAAWTADSQSLLLILSDGNHERSRIDLLSLASHQRRTLVSTTEHTEIEDLAASPDGSNLVYTRCPYNRCDLYVMPIAGGESRRLTHDKAPVAGVAWTPDSKQVIFASQRTKLSKLWRIEPAAKRPIPVPVAADQVGVFSPSLSRVPGGTPVRLAFHKSASNTDIRRTEIRRSGGRLSMGESVLISPSTQADYKPCYSPDGSKIAFISDRSGEREVWITEADGSAPRSLGPALGADLSWSPDGGFLAAPCTSELPGSVERDICIQPVKGGPAKRVVSTPKEEFLPLWSQDSKSLYFTADYSGRLEIYKVTVTSGLVRQITFHGGTGGLETPDGGDIFFFKDLGGPGDHRPHSMWKVPSDGGPEQVVLEGVYPYFLSVLRDGLYFLRLDHPSKNQDTLFLWRYGSEPPVAIAPLPHRPRRGTSGLPVSPDGRYFLTMHQDVIGVDLMIIDNFR